MPTTSEATLLDPGSLLATLAQSSAAVVAIVGGFLVSRLVQLSSEREGLRRQLVRARDELGHVTTAYAEAHSYRLANSQADFLKWVTDKVIEAEPDELDRDELLADNLPRGSSAVEMMPHLNALIDDVARVRAEVEKYLQPYDDSSLELNDLRKRGLAVPETQESLYERVVAARADRLPRPHHMFGSLAVPGIIDPITITSQTELRRLDESIREEQDLRSRKTMLEGEVARHSQEIERVGRPAGVTSAIAILGAYSMLGIVAPVVVMGLGLDRLSAWLEWLLVGAFVIGLAAVLGYVWWYARTLDDPIEEESATE